MSKKTTKASGLTIKRNNFSFTASWKIPKCGFGKEHKAWYWSDGRTKSVKSGKKTVKEKVWKSFNSVGPKTSKKTFIIDRTDFYPYRASKKLKAVAFKVQGTASKDGSTVYTESDPSEKTFKIKKPANPSLSVSEGSYPKCSFTWKVKVDKDDHNVFSRVKYQTALVLNSPKDGPKVSSKKWSSEKYSTKDSDTITYTEDTGVIGNGKSYTRWFRIMAQGPAGDSGKWVYKSHTYAIPSVPVITETPKISLNTATSYKITLKYRLTNTFNVPSTTTETKYLIAVPGENMSCPEEGSWTTAVTTQLKSDDGTGGSTFITDKVVGRDQCLWVRVDAKYGDQTAQGEPMLIVEAKGALNNPSGITIFSPDENTHIANISATNNSQVPDSFTVIRYYTEDDRNGKDIGIIPHGQTQGYIQFPDNVSESPEIGVYAAVSTYQYKNTVDEHVIRGKTYYRRSIVNLKYVYVIVENPIDAELDQYYDVIESTVESGDYKKTTSETVEYRLYDLENDKIRVENANGDTSDSEEVPISGGRHRIKCGRSLEFDSASVSIYLRPGVPYNIPGIFASRDVNTGIWYLVFDMNERPGRDLLVSIKLSNSSASIDPNTVYYWRSGLGTDENPYYYGIVREPILADIDDYYERTGMVYYAIGTSAGMMSDIVKANSYAPKPPKIGAEPTDISGTIRVTWDWTWEDATQAELSWSDHEDAWESTDEPSTYIVSKVKTAAWNISNLETGKVWYIRVRLISGVEDDLSYGGYSAIVPVDLRSAPVIPALNLSENAITENGSTIATWTYSTSDGSEQASAEIAEVIFGAEGEEPIYNILPIDITTQQTVTLSAKDRDWKVGETHNLAIRVTSSNGVGSDGWSNVVTVTIVDPIGCKIDSYSFENVPIVSTDEEGNEVTTNILSITEMPFSVSVKEYDVTTDTSVNSEKTYYDRSGEGTDDSPYVYTELNPVSRGWYELSNDTYILTEDTSIDSAKSYYIQSVTDVEETPYEYLEVVSSDPNPRELYWFELNPITNNHSVTLVVERAESFQVDKPDETDYVNFEYETIYIKTQLGDGVFNVALDDEDLIGELNDTAPYRVVATLNDELGQSAEDELAVSVNWANQATTPYATASIDEDNAIAVLRPIAPVEEENIESYASIESFPAEGDADKAYIAEDTGKIYRWRDSEYTENTDVCDIYRLSVDRPQLVFKGAVYGQVYVDPYPTIGEYGGHRFVDRTINGDYTLADGSFAWIDTDDIFETHANLIDFGEDQVELLYEVDISNSWSKDFQETKYLGGSIQGDWNRSVSRTSSMKVKMVSDLDQESIQKMRRLAEYPGICHVRTKDGSSYAADVQLNETYTYTRAPRFNDYDLSITRVESEVLDGMLYSDWEALNPPEPEEEEGP